MKINSTPIQVFAVCLAAALILSACISSGMPVEGQQARAESSTPIARSTVAPLPLPSTVIQEPTTVVVDSAADQDCTHPGENAYLNPEDGYCLLFPSTFEKLETANGTISIAGPNLDDSSEPVRVSLSIEVKPLTTNANLARLVDAFLSQGLLQDLPWEIERTTITLDGEPAEVLEDVPGHLSSRLAMVIHNQNLYTLSFHPSDVPDSQQDLELLYSEVVKSFRFIDAAQSAENAHPVQSAAWSLTDRTISFNYDSSLALWVDTLTIPGTPPPPEGLYPDSSPASTIFRLLGYGGGMAYQLPYPMTEARVYVFKTSDFAGYGDDLPNGYINQSEALDILLQGELDPAFCAEPHASISQALPFLPYVNSAQVFCAKPTKVGFEGGQGIRYLTAYSQDAGPVLDWFVFYTFQGLTDDGQYYVSAALPVQTGVFPLDSPANFIMGEQASQELARQLTSLEEKPENEFYPSLSQLDQMVKSFQIK
jgi:hypothetical protein